MWENQECFESCSANLSFGYTTVTAFLLRYSVWNTANQVRNGEGARGPIKSTSWETPDVPRDQENQEESLSDVALGQHGVVISTPLRCISVHLFKDKELLCCEKKAHCVESGAWTAAIRFICKCWQIKMSILNEWKIFVCAWLKKKKKRTLWVKPTDTINKKCCVCFAAEEKKGKGRCKQFDNKVLPNDRMGIQIQIVF